MNEYIIYTPEGYTTAPNEDVEVENCQMLGHARGSNSKEAIDNLLKDNPTIIEAGFDSTKFIVRQLLTDEDRTAIEEVLAYLWEDEARHDGENAKPGNHISPVLSHLRAMV